MTVVVGNNNTIPSVATRLETLPEKRFLGQMLLTSKTNQRRRASYWEMNE